METFQVGMYINLTVNNTSTCFQMSSMYGIFTFVSLSAFQAVFRMFDKYHPSFESVQYSVLTLTC